MFMNRIIFDSLNDKLYLFYNFILFLINIKIISFLIETATNIISILKRITSLFLI